jgi:hypothetical protein
MDKEYAITCNCGHTEKGSDRRMVEAKQWAHAIKDHGDQVSMMGSEMIYGILTGWDKDFAAVK